MRTVNNQSRHYVIKSLDLLVLQIWFQVHLELLSEQQVPEPQPAKCRWVDRELYFSHFIKWNAVKTRSDYLKSPFQTTSCFLLTCIWRYHLQYYRNLTLHQCDESHREYRDYHSLIQSFIQIYSLNWDYTWSTVNLRVEPTAVKEQHAGFILSCWWLDAV